MRSGNRRGQAMIMIVFSLTFLFAAMGLSIDLGYAYYLKARCQTAADAAASAAAVYAKNNGYVCGTGVTCGTSYTCAGVSPPTTPLQAGCLYATTDGPPSFTATMIANNTTPPGVTGNSPKLWIEATVSTSAPNLFLFGAGYHTASISAEAISGVSSSVAPGCVYVLSATASPAVYMTGASTLSATNCSIYVASTANDAVEIYGTSSISANRVIINGTYVDPAGTSISPAPVTGTVTDPLANLPAPTFSGCNYTDAWYYNGATATLNPGVYCGGITASDATLTLNPGTYILNGDGLIVENSGSITGSGVFFYNTGVNGQIAGPVTITGSGAVNLSAPTSGTYEGILFFQDRSVTYTTANSVSNAGGGTMTGTFYFPTTAFTFAGSSAVSIYDAFVVNTLTITGASYLKQDTTGTYTGLTQSSAALIQ